MTHKNTINERLTVEHYFAFALFVLWNTCKAIDLVINSQRIVSNVKTKLFFFRVFKFVVDCDISKYQKFSK
jgi:hypothetical protein